MRVLITGGAGFVDTLRAVWDTGDAAAPLDPRLPRAARDAVLALRPDNPLHPASLGVMTMRADLGPRRSRAIKTSVVTMRADLIEPPSRVTAGVPAGH